MVSENDLATSRGRKKVPISYLKRIPPVLLKVGLKQAQRVCALPRTM